MPRVFIKEGMRVGIPSGGLTFSIGEDGRAMSSLTLHVHFDVCPTWLALASGHLADAQVRAEEQKAAWQGDDASAKAEALEREFEASIQAIMAAATAMEAFYGVVQKAAEVPKAQREKWREKKAARRKQVGEVLRLAFGISSEDFRAVRGILKNIYTLRDMAVHPKGELAPALLHPELGVGVEGRFYYFRYAHAKQIVDEAHELIYQLVTNGTPKNAEVARYSGELRAKLAQERGT